MTQYVVDIKRFISNKQVNYYIVGKMGKNKQPDGVYFMGEKYAWVFPVKVEIDRDDNVIILDPFKFKGESREEKKRYKYYLRAKKIVHLINREFKKYDEDPEGYGDEEIDLIKELGEEENGCTK